MTPSSEEGRKESDQLSMGSTHRHGGDVAAHSIARLRYQQPLRLGRVPRGERLRDAEAAHARPDNHHVEWRLARAHSARGRGCGRLHRAHGEARATEGGDAVPTDAGAGGWQKDGGHGGGGEDS